jgi:hypothetical protein
MSSTRSAALINATVVGTVLQLAMVISGHWVEWIKLNAFAIGGVAISAVAGVIYASQARERRVHSATQGAVAGGVCALIGIGLSFALGDVPAFVFLVGTLSSTVAGAVAAAVAGGTAA